MPSPETAGIVIASYSATLAGMGWMARRFMARLDRQDETNKRIEDGVKGLYPLERRVKELERGHKQTRKILDKLTSIMEHTGL